MSIVYSITELGRWTGQKACGIIDFQCKYSKSKSSKPKRDFLQWLFQSCFEDRNVLLHFVCQWYNGLLVKGGRSEMMEGGGWRVDGGGRTKRPCA